MSCRLVVRNLVFSLLLGLATVVGFRSAASPAADTQAPTDVRRALQSGATYENSRQWVEAIDHYEKSCKQFPENEELTYGLRRSRICFGIDRRYTDPSFTRSLPGLTKYESQQTFHDVLEKVQTLYVEPISLTRFMAHGTETFYWALADERFQKVNVPARHHADVKQLRTLLYDRYWNHPIQSRAECTRVLDEICRQAEQTLELHAGPVIMEYVFGGCNALDDYSGYLTPARMKDLKGNINGQFVGLGVEMKADSGNGVLLMHVLPDSPADKAGLRSGEHIISIDGKDVRTATTDEAAGLLQGVEGSQVTLDVQGRVRKSPRRLTLTRRPVVVKSIPVATIVDRDAGIGYIQMTGFQTSTVEELDAALKKLRGEGMRALIWDLRGNPGGLLQTAVQVVDRFVAEGTVVSTRGRAEDQNNVFPAFKPGTWNVPLAVLVDGDSASASEIVAGAIRDHRRGSLVGRRTYGKWSVQSIYDLMGGGGLRLTTAKFYSPNGQTFGKIGVNPDIEVAKSHEEQEATRFADAPDFDTDPDVLKAVELLQGKLATR